MNPIRNRYPFTLAAAGAALALALQGCSSGSGGSEVGKDSDVAPTARAQVLNAGETNVFREGAEVLLTGKASEDADGPLLGWSWRQTAGPSVRLIERNSHTVSFTAPAVSAETRLTFELRVEDSTRLSGTSTVDVTVVPAKDADRFLSLDVRGPRRATFDRFKVVAALADGAATGSTPKPFTLAVRAYLVYPARSAPNVDCPIDLNDFAGGIPTSTLTQCLVAPLADVPPPLPGGGTGIESEWPANVTVTTPGGLTAEEAEALRISEWWNPHFTLDVPKLDVAEFNQQFVDSGERHKLLDLYNAHKARIVLAFSLAAPLNQQDATLILTNVADQPIVLPPAVAPKPGAVSAKIIENDGAGLPTAAVVPLETVLASITGRESALTAEVYYRTVDPFGSRWTLNSWLDQAGFLGADGRLLPEAIAGTGEFAHATYLNNYDLGFGRDMYARRDEYGNVYSFVVNYSTLEGAIRKAAPIVTVVMEYSPLNAPSDPTEKFIKFFTYADDGGGDSRRVASMDFDGRGERFTPGNCVVCHGGVKPPGVSRMYDQTCGNPEDLFCYAWPAQNDDGVDIADGNLQATFLPWDPESFLFADDDPAITDAPVPFDGVSLAEELRRDFGDYSRAGQAAQVKKLNQFVFSTYCDAAQQPGCGTDAARRLVEHWYGAADADGNLPGNAFDDSGAPEGWRNGEVVPAPTPSDPSATAVNPDTAEEVYQTIYAQHCRMCHTNMTEESLRFDTYQKFIAARDLMRSAVFTAGTMPAARLTMDRFWAPFDGGAVPGTLLAEHLAAIDNSTPLPAPGTPTAAIAGFDSVPDRGATVRLDGSDSSFASSFQWSLTAPAGSAATLVGAASAEPSFAVDLPGEYRVALAVNAGTVGEALAERVQTVVNRAPNAVNDMFQLDLSVGTALSSSVLAGLAQDSDLDGDALTVAPVSGQGVQHGTLTLNANGTFAYTFTGNVFAAPATDSFVYQVSDGFGGTAQATVTVALLAAPDNEAPSVPTGLSVLDASTVNGDSSLFRARLQWTASSDNNQVIGYNVYRNGSPTPTFHPSTAAAGQTVTFFDSTVNPDTSYQYRVSAVDAANESGQSSQSSITIVTSFRRNIHTGWGAGSAESIFDVLTCTAACHTGAFPSGELLLSGTAASVLSELNEAANLEAVGAMRVNTGNAPASLILCKPTDTCVGSPHGGLEMLDRTVPAEEQMYQTILRWIQDEAPDN